VLRFIFQSQVFPRSVRWCIEHARECLERLPRDEAALRVIGRLARNLDGAELARLSQTELHAFVDELQLGIGDLHEAIATTWFPPAQQIERAA
jgi:uncharacterized alpha-E superfamily protein